MNKLRPADLSMPLFLAGLAFVGLCAGGLFVAIDLKGIGSGDAAAWAQAIGAIGAILVTGYIASQSSRQARRGEIERQDHILKAATLVAIDATHKLDQVLAQIEQLPAGSVITPAASLAPIGLSGARDSLSGIPIALLPSRLEPVRDFMAFRRCLSEAIQMIETDRLSATNTLKAQVGRLVGEAHDCLTTLRREAGL